MDRSILFSLLILVFVRPVMAQDLSTAGKINSLMESCQFSQAARLAELSLSLDSNNTGLLLLEGKALAALSKYKEEILFLNRARLTDSTSIPVMNELVQAYRQSGDIEGAIRTAREAAAMYSDNPWFRLQVANLHCLASQYRKAIPLLLDLYRDDSTSFHIARQLGNCYNELRSNDSAIRFYRRALRLVPFDENTTGKLVNLFIRTDQEAMGLYFTRKYLEHDSTSVAILKQSGYCLYLMIDFSGAANQFRKCLALGDSTKFTLKYLGLACYKQMLYDSAAPHFLAAFRADTSDSEICFYYGVSAFRSGQNETGRQYLERALQLMMPPGPFLGSLYSELADASTASGNADTSVVFLEKALEADPSNNVFRFKLAYQYDYHLRKPYQALPWYREFLKNEDPAETAGELGPQQVSRHDYATSRIREITGKKK